MREEKEWWLSTAGDVEDEEPNECIWEGGDVPGCAHVDSAYHVAGGGEAQCLLIAPLCVPHETHAVAQEEDTDDWRDDTFQRSIRPREVRLQHSLALTAVV